MVMLHNLLYKETGKEEWELNPVPFGYKQARQTRLNSGGVAEGHPRFDKRGVAIIFYFLRVKNRTF